MIALSCGIKISAVRHLVLSQCTRVTDGGTDGQNYDSQDRRRICSRSKNCNISMTNWPLPGIDEKDVHRENKKRETHFMKTN